ncbi:MAG: hypothetical protein N2255_00105, partial [Kiritimatiellae bacterium]|nr:hypothetical protein [Kiritimatiellia bacterium]
MKSPTEKRLLQLTALLLGIAHLPFSLDAREVPSEYRIKRKEVFEFTARPVLQRKGDLLTIAFAVKDFCDVTIVIESAEDGIVRHLASGVLGENAPAPFQKDALTQAITWDGKDDTGAYVDDINNCIVRVSLGLKARFEQHFLWSPYRRICNQGHAPTLYAVAPFVAQPEGVYVFDGSMHDHLRLFDHDGNYLRTIYPFPRDKLDKLKGIKTQLFPQSGQLLAYKGGNYRSTLLTSGTNYEGNYLSQLFGMAAYAMAIQNGRVALVGNRLNRLGTDGTTAGIMLEGTETRLVGPKVYGMAEPDAAFLPRSAALSPDGKTLYITGWNREAGNPNWYLSWVPGVGRLDFENGEKVEVFAGSLTFEAKATGSEPGQFKGPVSVDTDSQGRVYVADRYNERVQIFDASGRYLKSIPVPGGEVSLPSEVCVDKLSGDIYVFSWYLDCTPFRKKGMHERVAKLFHFGPFDKPELKAEYSLPIPDQSLRGLYGGDRWQGREFRGTIDPWTSDGPRIWLDVGAYSRGRDRARLLVMRINRKEKRLDILKDFDAQAGQEVSDNGYWGYGGKWLAVRPNTGELYVYSGGSSAVVFDPGTGKTRPVKLPVDCVAGGLYFDVKGHAYLRNFRRIARFDADTWREVPFDYGEEQDRLLGVVPIPSPS